MGRKIYLAILDDHPSIIDGYIVQLNKTPEIEVVGTAHFGEELEPILAKHITDVLLLDVIVPTAPNNPNAYPILYIMPRLLDTYPGLHIVVISQYAQRLLIKKVMEVGASGYILKDDLETLRNLGSVVQTVAHGGIHLSRQAGQVLLKSLSNDPDLGLTSRQYEALSLCAAYPDWSTARLAAKLEIEPSTMRNLLSGTYLRLGVRTRAAAIAKAQQVGLITPSSPEIRLEDLEEPPPPQSPETTP